MRTYIENYFNETKKAIDGISWREVAQIAKLFHATYEHHGRIFTIGNGGSSAVASHFANDMNKTVLGHKGEKQARPFQVYCLSDNTPVFTAWANDLGYEHVFSEQLRNLAQGKDLLFAISSSGNSENIIRAVKLAKSRNVIVVGLTGFDGGRLKKLADASIHIKSARYAIIENAHDAICHLITSYFSELIYLKNQKKYE